MESKLQVSVSSTYKMDGYELMIEDTQGEGYRWNWARQYLMVCPLSFSWMAKYGIPTICTLLYLLYYISIILRFGRGLFPEAQRLVKSLDFVGWDSFRYSN